MEGVLSILANLWLKVFALHWSFGTGTGSYERKAFPLSGHGEIEDTLR